MNDAIGGIGDQTLVDDARVEVNTRTVDGCSSLFIAAHFNNVDVLNRLLAHPQVINLMLG
jgi:hypothetical protein